MVRGHAHAGSRGLWATRLRGGRHANRRGRERRCSPVVSARTSRGSAVPIGSLTTRSASSSYGVGSALTTTSRAPVPTAMSASPAAGHTCSDVPTARKTSQSAAAAGAAPPPARRASARSRSSPTSARRRTQARRVGLPRLTRSSALAHRRPVAAAHAHDLVHRPVDLEHPRRVGPGRLVQPVDVLGDQRAQPALPLEVDQRAVAGVGLRSASCSSRRTSQDRRRISGRPGSTRGSPASRRPGPASTAVRTPVVGDPAVGGDARPGQDGDPLGRSASRGRHRRLRPR